MSRYDVIVIGAGVVGMGCASYLQRAGHRVTVIDRLPPGRATSFGNGGGIASTFVLPLAMPVIIAGVRTSVIINIGTAALASTVGAKSLGTPIIVGLSGFNTAYIIQGAVVVGLLAIVIDLGFEQLLRFLNRRRGITTRSVV